MLADKPSILFVDAYDSFTNNIVSLLTTTLSCSVRVIHIDSPELQSQDALRNELRYYDAVVCGPGPGNPLNEKDVGIMSRIWQLLDEDIVPVLGICLGFQSLAVTFGAKIERLHQGLHGIVRKITHIGEDETSQVEPTIFHNVREVYTTMYQSLCIDIGQDSISDDAWSDQKWVPSAIAPNIRPLAWVEDSTGQDKRILVGIQHLKKPFWALQYHPESICTNEESKRVIENWFKAAMQWALAHGRSVCRVQSGMRAQSSVRESLLQRSRQPDTDNPQSSIDCKKGSAGTFACLETFGINSKYESRATDLDDQLTVTNILDALQSEKENHILLDSSNSHVNNVGTADVRGRYSIIGLDVDSTLRVEYQCGESDATFYSPQEGSSSTRRRQVMPLAPHGDIWVFMASFLQRRCILDGNPKLPFWGGFMGYTTYELGLQGIQVDPHPKSEARPRGRPDLCFAWIRRSIVIDHREKRIHIQQLRDHTTPVHNNWLDETLVTLRSISTNKVDGSQNEEVITGRGTVIEGPILTPNDHVYESKVEACQEHIRNGDAYELCLTDQTHVLLPREQTPSISNSEDTSNHNKHSASCLSQNSPRLAQGLDSQAWKLYKKLRKRQPAPFASFIRLGKATFISASPERFLRWDQDGRCELRPMKGTVKKTAEVSTLAQAEKLLQIPKEQAENLMIVDLVRHDLHGICGSGNVTVPRLMVVEEYASVFQMITVVEGQIPKINATLPEAEKQRVNYTRHTGIDVLAASLPPGSMTGAPKKRSCEILQSVEEYRDRSLYSGVVGYMDVGGRGDFSVNIRCMFRWDDEGVDPDIGDFGDEPNRLPAKVKLDLEDEYEVWHVGAGGAVTTLSTPIGEREEMQTKLNGTLGLFRGI